MNPRPLEAKEDGLERISTGHEMEERGKVDYRSWRTCMHDAWAKRYSSSGTAFRGLLVEEGVAR